VWPHDVEAYTSPVSVLEPHHPLEEKHNCGSFDVMYLGHGQGGHCFPKAEEWLAATAQHGGMLDRDPRDGKSSISEKSCMLSTNRLLQQP